MTSEHDGRIIRIITIEHTANIDAPRHPSLHGIGANIDVAAPDSLNTSPGVHIQIAVDVGISGDTYTPRHQQSSGGDAGRIGAFGQQYQIVADDLIVHAYVARYAHISAQIQDIIIDAIE